MELAKEDCEKTTFTTGSGLYHFNVMPMVLTNSSATFQKVNGGTLWAALEILLGVFG